MVPSELVFAVSSASIATCLTHTLSPNLNTQKLVMALDVG